MKIKNNTTISEVIPFYLNHVKATLKPRTHDFYRQYTGFVARFVGEHKIKKIDQHDIDEMIQLKRKENPKITNATLNKYITTVQQIYKYALDKPLELKKLKETQKEMQTISEETVSAILKYLKDNRHDNVNRFYEVFFRILIDTGIRLNEIRNLKIHNVDMLVPKIKLEVTKTDRERTVFITKYTHEILIDYIHQHELKSEFLFPGRFSEKVSEGAVYSKLRSLKKAIGFSESCSPHAWRHTFGTNWVDSDSQPHLLQKIMGHSKYETTQRYIHQNEKSQLRHYQNFVEKRGIY